MFHILKSSGCRHIPSYKEQTENGSIIKCDPSFVYICALDNKGIPLDNMAKVGDEVHVGTLLGVRKDFNIPVYSSVSGTIKAIVKKNSSLIGRPVDHFEIENDLKYSFDKNEALKKNGSKEEALEALRLSGVVGLGGAGFPTYIKFKANDIDTLIVNAVECEPYITTDFVKGTKGDVLFVLKTIAKLLDVYKIPKAIIACKAERVLLCESLTKSIIEFDDSRISLKPVKSVYPAGWERLLIEMVVNRKYDRLPAEAHVIVDNYQTIEAIGNAMFNGQIISKKLVTVSGLVNAPSNVLVPVGTLVKDLVDSCKGYSKDAVVLVNGGPMCGEHLKTDDVPLLLSSNAITVLEKKKFVAQECLRCGECSATCPRQLQPCEINYAAKRNDFDRCFDLGVMDCISCGLCSYVCPSHIEVCDGVKKAKLLTVLKSSKAKKK